MPKDFRKKITRTSTIVIWKTFFKVHKTKRCEDKNLDKIMILVSVGEEKLCRGK